MRGGVAGGTLSYRDQEFTLYRNGAAEQVSMNLDSSILSEVDPAHRRKRVTRQDESRFQGNGNGSRNISLAQGHLAGEVTVDFAPTGIVCSVDAPLRGRDEAVPRMRLPS